MKVDVKSFFESISERQVYHAFRSFGYPALISFELARLCTRFPMGKAKAKMRRWRTNAKTYQIPAYKTTFVGHLPQGAPTSPMLANIVCFRLDVETGQAVVSIPMPLFRWRPLVQLTAGKGGPGKS